MSGVGDRQNTSSGKPQVWWYVLGGVVILATVGGAIYFLSSSDDEEVDTTTKKVQEPAAGHGAPARAPSAADAAAAGEGDESDDEDGEDDEEGDDEVSKGLLLRLLSDLREVIQEKSDQLQSLVQSGAIDESEFEKQLSDAIPDLEEALHEKYKVSQRAILEAQSEYQHDPEVIAASRALRDAALPPFARQAFAALQDVVSGEGSVPDGMTPEKLARLVRANADVTIRKMNEIAQEVVSGGYEGEAAMRKFQEIFLTRARDLTLSTFAELGIRAEDFAASMERYGMDDKVQQAQQTVHMLLAMQQQMIAMRLSKDETVKDMMAAQMAQVQGMGGGGGGM